MIRSEIPYALHALAFAADVLLELNNEYSALCKCRAGFVSTVDLDWRAFSLFNCRQLIKRVIAIVLKTEMVCVMQM